MTIADTGRVLHITLSNYASTDARLDVYLANSLGHHLPGRIFSSSLPLTRRGEPLQVGHNYTDIHPTLLIDSNDVRYSYYCYYSIRL